jgi:hypothetical protein
MTALRHVTGIFSPTVILNTNMLLVEFVPSAAPTSLEWWDTSRVQPTTHILLVHNGMCFVAMKMYLRVDASRPPSVAHIDTAAPGMITLAVESLWGVMAGMSPCSGTLPTAITLVRMTGMEHRMHPMLHTLSEAAKFILHPYNQTLTFCGTTALFSSEPSIPELLSEDSPIPDVVVPVPSPALVDTVPMGIMPSPPPTEEVQTSTEAALAPDTPAEVGGTTEATPTKKKAKVKKSTRRERKQPSTPQIRAYYSRKDPRLYMINADWVFNAIDDTAAVSFGTSDTMHTIPRTRLRIVRGTSKTTPLTLAQTKGLQVERVGRLEALL